jgi:glutathione S-transferase
VTPREALFLSLPFIPEPLRSLLENALSRIARKAEVRKAMDELAGKVKHPLVDAIAFRLSSAWDVRVDAAIFDDLAGQLAALREEAAGRATAARASFFALVAVLGLLGAVLLFGYPAMKFMAQKIAGGFGM